MNTPDIFYAVLIATGLLLDHFVLWPGFQRRSQTDPSRARWWVWTAWMVLRRAQDADASPASPEQADVA